MKFVKTLSFLLLICLSSCNSFGAKEPDSNPIFIEYTNEVNNYSIKVIWMPDYYDSRFFNRLIGPAIFTIKDKKNNKVYNVTHEEFSIDLNDSDLKNITFKEVEGTQEFLSNKSFNLKMEYKLPSVIEKEYSEGEIHSSRNKGFKDFIPFFFKDINFDDKPELIFNNATYSEKGGYSKSVCFFDGYKYVQSTDVLFREKFQNFWGDPNDESALYARTTIDYTNKRIYFSWMSGCCYSGEDVYTFEGGNSIILKSEESVLEGSERIITTTDKNGKKTIKRIRE